MIKGERPDLPVYFVIYLCVSLYLLSFIFLFVVIGLYLSIVLFGYLSFNIYLFVLPAFVYRSLAFSRAVEILVLLVIGRL